MRIFFLVISTFFIGICSFHSAYAQVEDVQIAHPIYDFLTRAEALGATDVLSLSVLPLQRKEITAALRVIRKNSGLLSGADIILLEQFEREFDVVPSTMAIVFHSASDSVNVFFNHMLTDDEKSIYHYKDSLNEIRVVPLASLEYRMQKADSGKGSVVLGQAGIRLHGTIHQMLGYYLHITNGSVLSGDKNVALADPVLHRNIKFSVLNSDFDFTESHIRFDYDWFYASVGRETRLIGSGYANHIFTANSAPPFDAVTLGARFENFDYRFMHASLLSLNVSPYNAGFATILPSKYLAFHRFAYKDTWGEFAFDESLVYSGRGVDLAYLNPISFFKSLEHSLRDRDNSALGFDATFRPMKRLEIKGSFLLDDLIFSKIGTDYWGNKSAWNLGAMYSFHFPVDAIVEYTVVYPFTFSHFNVQNSMTNDGIIFAGELPPNTAELVANMRFWWGGRYPLILGASYERHGRNISDANGNLIVNAGGDVLQTHRYEDPENIPFLSGDLEKRTTIYLHGGLELVRGLNLQAYYGLNNVNGSVTHTARLALKYEDF